MAVLSIIIQIMQKTAVAVRFNHIRVDICRRRYFAVMQSNTSNPNNVKSIIYGLKQEQRFHEKIGTFRKL